VTTAALAIADALAERGFAIVPDLLDAWTVTALRERARELAAADLLRPAGVGRDARRTEDRDVRGDRIRWIDATHATLAERDYLAATDALRTRLNRELMLGLTELEVHYALYPPGTRYARHRDRFRDDDRRVLSCILYLNEGWTAEDGGALRLYADDGAVDVLPHARTFVAFLAERFDHEVLPARRERLAVTGWWLRR
jgi:SM-20-related protein